MTERDVIKECLSQIGWNQKTLAKNAGYNTPSGVGNRLNNKNAMRCDILVKLLSVMGYELVVRSSSSKNKSEWVISYDDKNTEKEDNEK